jgi:TolB-like protein
MKTTLLLSALAAVLLAGCAAPNGTRIEPTYEGAAISKFVALNQLAIAKLVDGFKLEASGDTPVLVSTIVNVNDTRLSAPLGRTLSEQYATHLANAGFNVKEMKLRGDVFVKEETGELMLSREVKDIARTHSASLVLVGTYSPAATYTYVSLKFVRTQDGRIVRAYNYALPNDKDVSRLLQVQQPATR